MVAQSLLLGAWLLGAAASDVPAVRVAVDASKVVAEVPRTLYGTGMEDVNHEIYGGLDAQRLYDESFEGQEIEPVAGKGIRPKPMWVCGRQWKVTTTADGRVTADRREPHLGAVAVALEPGKGSAAVANAGLNGWGISCRAGKRMQGRFFAKGAVGSLAVSLRRRSDGRVHAMSSVTLRQTDGWQRVDFVLAPEATDPAAEFVICAAGGGKVLIDDAYLVDEPTNAFGRIGCREDIVDGFRREGLTFLRWGGSMANSWGYLWKNMKDDRRPYDGFWFRTSSTGFLYKEFVRMADAMKLPCAFSIYAYEQVAKTVEIAEWLRQFKGDVYVQIGNEECAGCTPTCGEFTMGDCRRYCESLRLIVTEMRKANPRLKFVSALMFNSRHQDVMDEGFRLTDGYVDYWDVHLQLFGADVTRVVNDTRREIDAFRDMIRRLNPQTKMKLAIFEENGNEHGLRRALVHAGVLGICREQGDFLLTSCPANALQPYLQNENGWDQGQIFFTPDKVWLQPCGWAQQMASANHRDLLVSATSSDPQVMVSATKSRDGKSLVLHLVNATTAARPLDLSFANGEGWQAERVTVLSGDGPRADNTPEAPSRVSPADDTAAFSRTPVLKPYSYSVVVLKERSACSAESFDLDFAHGVPAGGVLRAGARVTSEGLVAADVTNRLAAGGFQFDHAVEYPEAFRLEADLVAGGLTDPATGTTRTWHESQLYDDMGDVRGADAPKRGLRVTATEYKGSWSIGVFLGYGDELVALKGPSCLVPSGTEVKFALTYDANRHVRIEFAGATKDHLLERTGRIARGEKFKTVVGDRTCPYHFPFDGVIRRIRLVPLARAAFDVRFVGRASFVRGEEGARMRLEAENFSGGEVRDVRAAMELVRDGRGVSRSESVLGTVPAGGRATFAFPVETRVKPGWRELKVKLTGRDAAGRTVVAEKTLRTGIGPRHAPRMTALIQDSNLDVANAAKMGFTDGQYGDGSNFTVKNDLSSTNAHLQSIAQSLDEALVEGIGYGFSGKFDNVLPEGVPQESFARRDEKGEVKRLKKPRGALEVEMEAGDERLLKSLEPSWSGYGRLLAQHPAFRFVVPYSERRDHAFPSWGGDAARYKAETGREMPKEIGTERTFPFAAAKKRYPDGVVPDDDPILAYYRWFWRDGDGWPRYVGAAAQAFRRGADGKGLFTTFWDPGVRCPPCWGSGGAVDMLSQWIYANPEPMAVAGSAEEILAMTAGRPGQKAMIHTQLMCYRRQIAPENVTPSNLPPWMGPFRGATFLAIPPDVLREACWSMFAKPMYGYSFYPFNCVQNVGAYWYPYSCPELGETMADILRNTLAPLGPVLLKLGRAKPDVAVFECFTSVVMGAPYAMGWNAPPVTFVQRARLDPCVIYEDTVRRDSLDGIKVVFAPNCRFLTPEMIAKFEAFRKRGGILVGDGELLKALKADITVPTVRFAAPPKEDQVAGVGESDPGGNPVISQARQATRQAKLAMVANAEKLRAALKGRYVAKSDSSTGEIVVYNRRWRNVDYLVAVNDNRTFGDYVGQWGRMMEKGLPTEGSVTLRDEKNAVGAVYELSRGGQVPFVREGDRVRVPVKFDTCDGRLFAFLPKPIASVDAEVRANGDSIGVRLSVRDADGQPAHALLPVEVRVYDASGAELDGAGYLAAEEGVAEVTVLRNFDDAPGAYRVVCRDRASGLTVEKSIRPTSQR